MSSNDYQPISCDLHSEYELLAMHRKPVTVQYLDDQGAEQHFQGIIKDLVTRDGAEYMQLEGEDGTLEVRLDRIERVRKH
ncbi:MAG: transcriptional antiterminator, Rof [Gammaproteobacteria bacterium]|nr:MAG: transcriptional antiterminator, Rof [Gammaproteobacteria bacterium]RTZ75392.1 MAG: transcriptional antiterminator, Rof [Gammaproteobacteria bacterium]